MAEWQSAPTQHQPASTKKNAANPDAEVPCAIGDQFVPSNLTPPEPPLECMNVSSELSAVLQIEEDAIFIMNDRHPQLNGVISVPTAATWNVLPQPLSLRARGSSLQANATLGVATTAGRAVKSVKTAQYDIILKPDAKSSIHQSETPPPGPIPVIRYRLRRLRFIPLRIRKNTQRKGSGMVMLSVEIAANTALSTELTDVSLSIVVTDYPSAARQPSCKPGADWNRQSSTLGWPAKTAAPLSLAPGSTVVVQALLPSAAAFTLGAITARCRCRELLSDVEIQQVLTDVDEGTSSEPVFTASASKGAVRVDVRGSTFRMTLPGDKRANKRPNNHPESSKASAATTPNS